MCDDTCRKDGLGKWQCSLGGLFALMTACSLWMAVSGRDLLHYSVASAINSVLVLLMFLGIWKVFRKAGQPGWAAFVPIYNLLLMTRISGFSSWWAALFLIPGVNIVIYLGISVSIARRFGHGDLFGAGLALFPQVSYPILGFGGSQYDYFIARTVWMHHLGIRRPMAVHGASRRTLRCLHRSITTLPFGLVQRSGNLCVDGLGRGGVFVGCVRP